MGEPHSAGVALLWHAGMGNPRCMVDPGLEGVAPVVLASKSLRLRPASCDLRRAACGLMGISALLAALEPKIGGSPTLRREMQRSGGVRSRCSCWCV